MEKKSFTCDYNEGAHPLILQRLLETNMIQEPGYGEDSFTASAREKIRQAARCPSWYIRRRRSSRAGSSWDSSRAMTSFRSTICA